MKHQDATNIHTPYTWKYANSAARTGATGFVTADITKWALQLSDNTTWMLTATTPTWVQMGTTGGSPNTVTVLRQANYTAANATYYQSGWSRVNSYQTWGASSSGSQSAPSSGQLSAVTAPMAALAYTQYVVMTGTNTLSFRSGGFGAGAVVTVNLHMFNSGGTNQVASVSINGGASSTWSCTSTGVYMGTFTGTADSNGAVTVVMTNAGTSQFNFSGFSMSGQSPDKCNFDMGLVSHWRLDESVGIMSDMWGINDMTASTFPTQAAGPLTGTYSVSMDGSTAYGVVSSSSSYTVPSGGDFTMTCWVYFNSVSNNMNIISKNTGFGGNGAQLRHSTFPTFDTSNPETTASSTSASTTGTWHLWRGWYDHRAQTANFQEDNGTIYSVPCNTPPISSTALWKLGENQDASSWKLNGRVTRVSFYNRLLNSTESSLMWNGGSMYEIV